jgi:hypothetical protein
MAEMPKSEVARSAHQANSPLDGHRIDIGIEHWALGIEH